MEEQDIMEELEPVTDINLHFTVLKDSLGGIGTSAIDTSVAVIEGMVVHTGVVGIDTSVADTGEEVIEVVIIDDVNDINIKGII